MIDPETTAAAIIAARAIYGANGGRLPNGQRRGEYGTARLVAGAVLGERHPERDALRATLEVDLVMWRDAHR